MTTSNPALVRLGMTAGTSATRAPLDSFLGAPQGSRNLLRFRGIAHGFGLWQIYAEATSFPGMKYSSSNIEPFCHPARVRMPCPFSHIVGCPHRYAVVVSGRKPQ